MHSTIVVLRRSIDYSYRAGAVFVHHVRRDAVISVATAIVEREMKSWPGSEICGESSDKLLWTELKKIAKKHGVRLSDMDAEVEDTCCH